MVSFLLSSENPVIIEVSDSTLYEFTEDFYGIQYNKYAFNSPRALEKMEPLQIRWVRQWAYPSRFHPTPEAWDWKELDEKINQADSLGYNILLCLFQGEDWNIDGTDDCWWQVDSATIHWKTAAYELASRYQDKVDRFLLFDELHYLEPDSKYYISFKRSAEIYMEAAREIKKVSPDLKVGGPSGFAGWENGHWANYVLQEPQGREHLDFITSNIFLIWSPEETDKTIVDRTIWYEEAPQKIRKMIGESCPPIILDAYNINGLWQLDGEPWTDPRNTNFLGALYHALAKLHAAKGNFDLTLHWDTLGGFGIFQWFPDYTENPNYFCWKFLIDFGGLESGSRLVECLTSENPQDLLSHHGGMNVMGYKVQPFAVKNKQDEYDIILINKYDTNEDVKILSPERIAANYRLYRFDETNQTDNFPLIENGNIKNDTISIHCPAMSISVVQVRKGIVVGIDRDKILSGFELSQNYPNPFNSETTIEYHLSGSAPVTLDIFSVIGKRVDRLVHQNQGHGTYKITWAPSDLATGLYYYKIQIGKNHEIKKMVYLK